ncbi:MAG: BatD family protein [Bacteroidales bacterium]|nr:BatD family protein [Bacteroidales bacterium]
MMMTSNIRLTLLVFLITLAGSLTASAQGASFSVHAPAQVVEGNNFTVTFRVTNANAQISKAQAPQLKGCTLLFGPGVSTMESYSFINGTAQSSVQRDYTFTYRADKAGTVTVPSLSINDNGKTLTSKRASITILPPDRSSRQQQSAPAYDDYQGSSGTSPDIKPNDIIVTVSMSKDKVYENEAVIATIRVYTKHDITSFRATTLPSFDGFLSEELPVNEQPHLVHFRGDNYYTVIVKKCLLYPQKAGKLTINSGRYDVTLQTYEIVSNGFFATRRPISKNITTLSNSVNVTVSPLPEPRPAGFNGAVGTAFTAKATLEPSLLRTNEAATYTLTVNGTGNIKYLTIPDIDFGTNVEEYNPESDTDTKFNGSDLTGKFTATYTFIPQHEGVLKLPETPFVYFNPATGKYVTVTIPAIERKILKGSAAPSAAMTGSSEKKDMDDILYIKPLKNETLTAEHHRVLHTLLYVLCYIIVICGLAGAVIVYRRYLKLNADVIGRRTARANSVATKRLKTARTYLNAHNAEKYHEALAAALWGYISDKLRIPASALTRDNISDQMGKAGFGKDLIDRTIKVLDDCEMARFTPDGGDSHSSQLYDETSSLIGQLESFKRKNRQ